MRSHFSKSLTGLQAIVEGVMLSGIEVVTGVYGYPVDDIIPYLVENDVNAMWSINEKVATEIALGVSASGKRAMVVLKHVGVNIASDPLITASFHGIGSGLVVLAGDDPSAVKSQNEQDSRLYGLIGEFPVFDPSTPSELVKAIVEGVELSELIHSPVLIRVTSRVLESSGFISDMKSIESSKVKLTRNIAWKYTEQGRRKRHHLTKVPIMKGWSEVTNLNQEEINGNTDVGIISSGFCSSLVRKVNTDLQADHLHLGMVFPFPERKVMDFLKNHSRVLVVEETYPFIERFLTSSSKTVVLGKLTGHMPVSGLIEKKDVHLALEYIEDDIIRRKVFLGSIIRPEVCEKCSLQKLFNVIRDLAYIEYIPEPVALDLGCSVLCVASSYGITGTAYSLGSSPGVAIGISMGTGKKSVALCGDMGFFHTGVQGIIESVERKARILYIILSNRIAARTGGQKFVGGRINLEKLLLDLGVTNVITVNGDIMTEEELKEEIMRVYDSESLDVLVFEFNCVRN